VRPVRRVWGVRQQMTATLNSFSGADWSTPHEALDQKTLHDAINLDVVAGRITSRRGSKLLISGSSGNNGFVISAVDYATPHGECVITQTTTGDFFYQKIDGSNLAPVALKDFAGSTALNLTGYSTMQVSGGRVYIFSSTGNRIIEWTGSNPFWRTMGDPAPDIENWTTVDGLLNGSFVYAVECVVKESNIVVRSSGIRRMRVGLATVIRFTGNRAPVITVKADAYDGTDLFSSSLAWTHIRLYRSKELSSLVGAQNELYQVKEVTRASFQTASRVFTADNVEDDDLDGSTLVTANEIDLKPLPSAKVGAIVKARIWVGACPYEDDTLSKAYYGQTPDTRYAELFIPLQSFIPMNPGDGQSIIAMESLDDSLWIAKECSTWIVSNGDPSSGASLVDPVIGVIMRQSVCPVPGIGIAAMCSDGFLRIYGRDGSWTNVLGGKNISEPIREVTKNATRMQCVWHNGKLFVNPCGDDGFIYVLHLSHGCGWTRYKFPTDKNGSAVIDYLLQVSFRKALVIIPYACPMVKIENEEGAYPFYDWRISDSQLSMILGEIKTPMVQSVSGMIEVWSITALMSLIVGAIVQHVYSTGKVWPNASASMSPDPQGQGMDQNARSYQWFPPIIDGSSKNRPIGRDVSFHISFTGKATIHAIEVFGLTQSGPLRVGYDPVNEGA